MRLGTTWRAYGLGRLRTHLARTKRPYLEPVVISYIICKQAMRGRGVAFNLAVATQDPKWQQARYRRLFLRPQLRLGQNELSNDFQ